MAREELEQVKRERDTWKRLAEAAMRDLETLCPCYCCEHYSKELDENGRECDPVCDRDCVRASEWKWRGPCEENGSMPVGEGAHDGMA